MVSLTKRVGLASAAFLFTGLLVTKLAGDHGVLETLMQRIASAGPVGMVVMALLFVIASFPVPLGTTPLILGSGFLWELWPGYLVVTIGSMVGASLAFVVCRRLFAAALARRLEESTSLRSAVKAVDRHAVKLCVFVRFMPVPFGLQNALFAVSHMGFLKYFAATFVGLTPESLLLLHVGAKSGELVEVFSEDNEGSNERKAFLIAQILLFLLAAGVMVWKGRQIFRQIVLENEEKLRSLADTLTPSRTSTDARRRESFSGRESVSLDMEAPDLHPGKAFAL